MHRLLWIPAILGVGLFLRNSARVAELIDAGDLGLAMVFIAFGVVGTICGICAMEMGGSDSESESPTDEDIERAMTTTVSDQALRDFLGRTVKAWKSGVIPELAEGINEMDKDEFISEFMNERVSMALFHAAFGEYPPEGDEYFVVGDVGAAPPGSYAVTNKRIVLFLPDESERGYSARQIPVATAAPFKTSTPSSRAGVLSVKLHTGEKVEGRGLRLVPADSVLTSVLANARKEREQMLAET